MSKKLAKLGATLILVDIDENANNQTKDEILSDNGIAYAYKCDVGNHGHVKHLAQQVDEIHDLIFGRKIIIKKCLDTK